MSKDTSPMTYASAGVDIDAANELVQRISPLAARTRIPGVVSGLGGFGGLFDLKSAGLCPPGEDPPLLVSSTDGVGTKLKLAFKADRHDTVGIDCVAMCVNDLLTTGARPLFFLDYFATGKLKTGVAAEVIAGIARGCELAGCALLGGETAEMPGMYTSGEYDIAGFSVGAVPRTQLLPKTDTIKPFAQGSGDVIVGVASAGFHSNGFSLIRRVIDAAGLELSQTPQGFDSSLAELLLTPTTIYRELISLWLGWDSDETSLPIKAMAHITGGGLVENIPRVLPESLAAHLDPSSWSRAPLFDLILKHGEIPMAEAWRVFNMGIGLTAVLPAEVADAAIARAAQANLEAWVIGHITHRSSDAVTGLT